MNGVSSKPGAVQSRACMPAHPSGVVTDGAKGRGRQSTGFA